MARNARPRVETRFSHSAVRGYASRGRGEVWHLIIQGPVIAPSKPGEYPWPHYISLCGSHVETLPQLKAAAAETEPVWRPTVDVPTKFCPCCAATKESRLSTVWTKAVAAGEWRLAAAEMLNMLDRLDQPEYLGTGDLAPLR